ncbi:Helicase [Neofusicoccum parvum]|uniref:Helicase n=1 Tax=Neofusicoccum parvum TaxID=310453 RepID=A0ACB5SLJ2_9PEZI|nr:Helicase [Neofusicoccum parvum]
MSFPSCCSYLRKSTWSFSTTWHSSMMILSSCLIALSRFKNVMNSSLSAASGVTSTTDSASGGRLASYSAQRMPSLLQRSFMSARSAMSGTTTTVVPPGSVQAGSMNKMLFLAPVGITATTGLTPAWMAVTASS